MSDDLFIGSAKRNSVNEIIKQNVPYQQKNIQDVYNELIIQFKKDFGIIFRAYNDGVAYRIVSQFKDSITVKSETAIFNFTKRANVYAPLIQKKEGLDIYHTSFEELYQYKSLDSISSNDEMFSPALISTIDNIKIAITESDLLDYPGMFLKGTNKFSLHADFAPYPAEEKSC